MHNAMPRRDFASERMESNQQPGRMLLEMPLNSRPGAVPTTAVRQMNSQQAPAPQSDRLLDDQEETE